MEVARIPANVMATIIDGRLYCEIRHLYQYYEWVTGHTQIFTHQLPGYFRRLEGRLDSLLGIDKSRLKQAIDAYQAVSISERPISLHQEAVCNWLVSRGFDRYYEVPKGCFSDDPVPALTDGIPNQKKIIFIGHDPS